MAIVAIVVITIAGIQNGDTTAYAAEENTSNISNPQELEGISSISTGISDNIEPSQSLFFGIKVQSAQQGIGRVTLTLEEQINPSETYNLEISYITNSKRYWTHTNNATIRIAFLNDTTIDNETTITTNTAGITENTLTVNVSQNVNNIQIDYFYNQNGVAPPGEYWINILKFNLYNSTKTSVKYQSYLYSYLKGQFENAYNQGAIDASEPGENEISNFNETNIETILAERIDEPSTGNTINNIVYSTSMVNSKWKSAITVPAATDNFSIQTTNYHVLRDEKNTIAFNTSTTAPNDIDIMFPAFGYYIYTNVKLEPNTTYNFSFNFQKIKTDGGVGDNRNLISIIASQGFIYPGNNTISIGPATVPGYRPTNPITPENANTQAFTIQETSAINAYNLNYSGTFTTKSQTIYTVGLYIQVLYDMGFNKVYLPNGLQWNITNLYLTSGKNNTYAQGYENGFNDGKEDGYNDGYIEGNTNGYNTGHAAGYQEGYDSGLIAGNGLSSTIGSLLNTVQAGLNVDLIGEISLGDLLNVMLGVLLVFCVIKFFAGG